MFMVKDSDEIEDLKARLAEEQEKVET